MPSEHTERRKTRLPVLGRALLRLLRLPVLVAFLSFSACSLPSMLQLPIRVFLQP